MRAKERIIKDLDTLNPVDVVRVYDLILSLKGKDKTESERSSLPLRGYLRVRKALEMCQGSLSDDVLAGREDRI